MAADSTTPITAPPPGEAADAKAQQRAGAAALKELTKPVAGGLALGRAMAVVSAVLAVVP